MIGVGVNIWNGQLPVSDHSRVLDMSPEMQADIVKLLVRYRIVAKAPQFVVGPCPDGLNVCIRSDQP